MNIKMWNMGKWMAAVCACLFSTAVPASAIIFQDFQADTSGAAPADGAVTLGAGGSVLVAGPATAPADPFGTPGNQSLYFNQPGTPFSQVTFTGAAQGEGLLSGTASLRFFPDTSLGDTRAQLRLQDAAATGEWGPYVQISAGTRIHVADGGTVLRRTTIDTVWLANQVNELVLEFDAVSLTYWGTLNGVRMVTEDAAGYVGTDVFAFAGTPASISQAVLRAGGIAGDTQIFFDDVAVVPEPAAAALLLGGAALSLLAVRSRRRGGLA